MTLEIPIDPRLFKPLGLLTVAGLVLWGVSAIAAPGDPVPNQFQPGDVVSSAKINANFAELRAQIVTLAAKNPALETRVTELEAEVDALSVGGSNALGGGRIVTASGTVLSGAQLILKAICDADEVAISGGFHAFENDVSAYRVNPSNYASDELPGEWHVYLDNPGVEDSSAAVYAVCVPKP